MPGRTVFLLQQGSYEAAYQAASMGLAAASGGDLVYFVLSFDALRQLARGTFGHPHTEREIAESARAEGLGIAPPERLLQQARSLGAKLVACDATVKICGLGPGELEGKLDDVLALASLWRLTDGARVVSL